MKTSTRFTLQSLVCTLVLGAFSSQCLGQYYAETDDRSSIFSWSFQFSAPPKPFSYFNADTQSASIINAYLLSYLSNRIYDDTFLGFGYNQRWEDEFAQELGLNGLELGPVGRCPVKALRLRGINDLDTAPLHVLR